MPNTTVSFGAFNTAKNEVNGISNRMASQLWAFGPNGNREPVRYNGADGYNHEQVLAWVQAVATSFDIVLEDKSEEPEAPLEVSDTTSESAGGSGDGGTNLPLNVDVAGAMATGEIGELLRAAGVQTDVETALKSRGIVTLQAMKEAQLDDRELRALGVSKMRARKLLLRALE